MITTAGSYGCLAAEPHQAAQPGHAVSKRAWRQQHELLLLDTYNAAGSTASGG